MAAVAVAAADMCAVVALDSAVGIADTDVEVVDIATESLASVVAVAPQKTAEVVADAESLAAVCLQAQRVWAQY